MSSSTPATQEKVNEVFGSITRALVLLQPQINEPETNAEYEVLTAELSKIRNMEGKLSPEHLPTLEKILEAFKGDHDANGILPRFKPTRVEILESGNLVKQKGKDKSQLEMWVDDLVTQPK